MTLRRLWAFLAIALPTLGALIANLPSVDLAYQLRAGAEILADRAIPTVDTWTFTAPGATWFDQQWGSQVILAAVYQVAGWSGLVVARAMLVAVIFSCLYVVARRRGLDQRWAAWLTLAAFVVSAVALGLRPQLLGMAVFAAVLLVIGERHRHPRLLWLVPLLVVAWANLHGSFFLGPAVLGLAWLEDLRERRASANRTMVVAVVTFLATFVTPFGPFVWRYALGLSTDPLVTQRITEWQPPSLRDGPGLLFFGSVALVVLLLARRGRPAPWPALAWLGTFVAVGAYAIRGVAWWSLGAVPAVAGLLAARSDEPAVDDDDIRIPPIMRRLNAAIAIMIVLAGMAILPVWRPVDPDLRAPAGVVGLAPPGITTAVRHLARPGDRLFAPQPWGSWFEFAIADLPVAMDSRIEVFPPRVWTAFEGVLDGVDGWQQQLADWRVTIVVAGLPTEAGLADRLTSAGWREVHRDPDGVVFVAPDRPS